MCQHLLSIQKLLEILLNNNCCVGVLCRRTDRVKLLAQHARRVLICALALIHSDALIENFVLAKELSILDRGDAERRRYPRVQAKIPVEIRFDTHTFLSRVVTEEISLCGCYVETMFTFDIGTKLSLTFWLDGDQVQAAAVVVTKYPQVGNGFEFIDMLPEHRLKLRAFILACERQNSA